MALVERTKMTLGDFPSVIAHPFDPEKQLELYGFVSNTNPFDKDEKTHHYVAICPRNSNEWHLYDDVTASRARKPKLVAKVIKSVKKVYYPEIVIYAAGKKL